MTGSGSTGGGSTGGGDTGGGDTGGGDTGGGDTGGGDTGGGDTGGGDTGGGDSSIPKLSDGEIESTESNNILEFHAASFLFRDVGFDYFMLVYTYKYYLKSMNSYSLPSHKLTTFPS